MRGLSISSAQLNGQYRSSILSEYFQNTEDKEMSLQVSRERQNEISRIRMASHFATIPEATIVENESQPSKFWGKWFSTWNSIPRTMTIKPDYMLCNCVNSRFPEGLNKLAIKPAGLNAIFMSSFKIFFTVTQWLFAYSKFSSSWIYLSNLYFATKNYLFNCLSNLLPSDHIFSRYLHFN